MASTYFSSGFSMDPNANAALGRARSKARTQVGRIDPVEEKLAVWGEPKLHVRDISSGQFGFQLRSRVNTPILSGGPLPVAGDIQSTAKALLLACTKEELLRVDSGPDGFVISLMDPQGAALGCTDPIETEALARAMIRLIVVQARSAAVVLPRIGSSSDLQLPR